MVVSLLGKHQPYALAVAFLCGMTPCSLPSEISLSILVYRALPKLSSEISPNPSAPAPEALTNTNDQMA